MVIRLFATLLLCLVSFHTLHADDAYNAVKSEDGVPEEVAEPIAKLMSPEGIKLVKGESRTICEVWLCKEWPVQADFEPSAQILYPFTPGQLVGVLKFPRKGADFRDQPINKGVYTLRYMQQPVDGNHVGTSPTRDFLLLVSAETDQDPAVLDYRKLVTVSAEAAESSHPAMFCMQKAQPAESLPNGRYNEEHEWQILQFSAPAKAGDKTSPLAVDLVVEGIAAE